MQRWLLVLYRRFWTKSVPSWRVKKSKTSWNITHKGKTKFSKKTASQCHFFHQKSHKDWRWDPNYSAKVRIWYGVTSSTFIVPYTLHNKRDETGKPKLYREALEVSGPWHLPPMHAKPLFLTRRLTHTISKYFLGHAMLHSSRTPHFSIRRYFLTSTVSGPDGSCHAKGSSISDTSRNT
jgi:hypothetical protein